MRKVCYHCRWQESCSFCESNGITCVYLIPTERVVCWHTNYCLECNQPICCKYIDGKNVIIKDRDESLIRIDGKPLSPKDRHDSMWTCRIRNNPFVFSSLNTCALVIMDMWDKHPGTGSSYRVPPLAKAINEFACFLRERGALIIHSPSERGVYSIHNPQISSEARQARKNAIDARDIKSKKWERQRFFYLGDRKLSEAFDHIVEGAGEEWPSQPNQYTGQPTFQSSFIEIKSCDAISSTKLDMGFSDKNAYPELLALTENRPNLIFCGIHTNMCILARPNSMRVAAKSGKSLWLVRDLTDASLGEHTTGLTKYAAKIDGSKRKKMFYNHFEGTDLVVDWIGKNVGAETWTSDFVTGKERFRFPFPYGDDPHRIWPKIENFEKDCVGC